MFSRIKFSSSTRDRRIIDKVARERELEVCPKRRLSSQAAKNAKSIIKSVYRVVPDECKEDHDDHDGEELEFSLGIVAGNGWTKVSKHWYFETTNGPFDGKIEVVERENCYVVNRRLEEDEALELVRLCYETLLLESSRQLSSRAGSAVAAGRNSNSNSSSTARTVATNNILMVSTATQTSRKSSRHISIHTPHSPLSTSTSRQPSTCQVSQPSTDFNTELLAQARVAYWSSPWEVAETSFQSQSSSKSISISRKSSHHDPTSPTSAERKPSAWPRGFSSTLQSGFYGRRRRAAEKLFNLDFRSSRKRSSGAGAGGEKEGEGKGKVKRKTTLPIPPEMSEAMARAMQKLALEDEQEQETEVEVVQTVDVFAMHEGTEVGMQRRSGTAVRVERGSAGLEWSS